MTAEERRERIRAWQRTVDVSIRDTWNGVQRGDKCIWDPTGEECLFLSHVTDKKAKTEWWTFVSPDHERLMHASRVYFVWAGGPPLHGLL